MNVNPASSQITVHNLSVIYGNGYLALQDANFTLQQGSICALLGSNGSGKSTLFKTIMGLVKPSQGTVTINDESVKAALKKNIIAYVPQLEEIDWNFPVVVKEVVMMGRYAHMNFLRIATSKNREYVSDAMQRMGIGHLANRQIGELSGGQKKRVFLARALAQEAKILLLDEPFTGIDLQTELAIINILKELRDEGCIILISTHNLSSVPSFADEIILINKQIIAVGPTQQVFTPENLAQAFGKTVSFIAEESPVHSTSV